MQLHAEWDNFVQQNNIKQEFLQWYQANAEAETQALTNDLVQQLQRMDQQNGVSEWVQANNVERRIQGIVDRIDSGVAEAVAINAPVNLSTITVNAVRAQNSLDDLQNIEKSFERFAQEKNLRGQFQQWERQNNFDGKAFELQQKYSKAAQEFSQEVKLEQWASQNRVEQRIKSIVNDVKTSVTEIPSSNDTFKYFKVDDAKVQKAEKDAENLGNQIKNFVRSNRVKERFLAWYETNAKRETESLGQDLANELETLDRNNGIQSWVVNNNVEERVRNSAESFRDSF